ncbi:29350_t:CDS:2, partial [Gigaspora margarita]
TIKSILAYICCYNSYILRSDLARIVDIKIVRTGKSNCSTGNFIISIGLLEIKGLQQGLKDISISDLTWRDPIASQPLQNMKLVIPEIIQEKCNEFVENFSIEILDELPQKLSHNKTWKEPEEVLVEITEEILNTSFCPKFENAQSEETYVTDVVVPLLRATLKELPVRKIALLSTAERQSVASADRKGDGKQGKRPDVMFIEECEEKLYDSSSWNLHLWREMNDGMTWVHKGCKPDKNEFGILGIQISGKIMHLNVLIKDADEIHRLYRLCSVEIPLQPTDGNDVFQFVGALLLLRNIIIVNISMLLNAPKTKSERLKKRKGHTVHSDPE